MLQTQSPFKKMINEKLGKRLEDEEHKVAEKLQSMKSNTNQSIIIRKSTVNVRL
jgi:hypothetical protein